MVLTRTLRCILWLKIEDQKVAWQKMDTFRCLEVVYDVLPYMTIPL